MTTREQDENRIIRKTSECMARKLRARREHGDWKPAEIDDLYVRLGQELGELMMAIEGGETPEAVFDEGADCQNIIAMVCDVYALRRKENAH